MRAYLEIEMPKSCGDCPCGSVFSGFRCMAEHKEFEKYPFDGREDWCPLVLVPEHGRIGDLDELAKKIEHDRYNHTHTDGLAARHHVAEYGHFLIEIAAAPTIIPASEEGE